MKKEDKKTLILFAICLILFMKGFLFLIMGADYAMKNHEYKPILWFVLSVWQLLLCLAVLLVSHILRTEENVKNLVKTHFNKIELYVVGVFGITVLAFSFWSKSSIMTTFGLTLIFGCILAVVLPKKDK